MRLVPGCSRAAWASIVAGLGAMVGVVGASSGGAAASSEGAAAAGVNGAADADRVLEEGSGFGCANEARYLGLEEALGLRSGPRTGSGPSEGGGGVFNPANGADFRNWAPDRRVDYRSLRLDLDFPELESGRFAGRATYTIQPIGVPVDSIVLDCEDLHVNKVTCAGKELEHYCDGRTLTIRFPQALPPSETTLVIDYGGDKPTDGIVFTKGVAGNSRYTPEVHTQGQTESNHFWFPCHDFPNLRMPVEVFVTVPAGLSASSNGKLIEKTDKPSAIAGAAGTGNAGEAGNAGAAGGARTTWHWKQEKPIVPYLVSIVAGDFAIVPLKNPKSGVEMHVWVPQQQADCVERTFGNTDRMIALFEKVFGQKYPWARYDQLCVKNFGAGGMENASATTLHPGTPLDEIAAKEEDQDGLIAHELCHQWTGDLITCRTWAHIWLNEGWATYGSALWAGERDGPEAYLDSIFDNMRVAERDSTDGPAPMVSPIYKSAGETFRRAPNPYPKGASILHMLHELLGPEVFTRGVHLYFDRFKGSVAETSDFRRALEDASGLDLEWFFDQWCFRPGCPRLDANVSYDAASRTLRVQIDQTQKIDEKTPAFRLNLPILVQTAAGTKTLPFELRTRSAVHEFTLDGPPSLVAIDPNLCALKTIKVSMPQAFLRETLLHGPTEASRRAAMDALKGDVSPETIEAMTALARDTKARRSLRSEAIRALAAANTDETRATLLALLQGGVDDARVRGQLVNLLSKQKSETAIPMLVKIAREDPSYTCKVNAAEALAALKAKEQGDVLVELTKVNSHSDRVRQAAIDALADLEDVRALPAARELAQRGNFDRARPSAIDILARLAPKADATERAAVVADLVAMLDDPERRSSNAAGDALARLKAQEALPRLDSMASGDRDPSRRDRATQWAKRIRGEETAAVPAAGAANPTPAPAPAGGPAGGAPAAAGPGGAAPAPAPGAAPVAPGGDQPAQPAPRPGGGRRRGGGSTVGQ